MSTAEPEGRKSDPQKTGGRPPGEAAGRGGELAAWRWPFALVALALVALLFYRETLSRVDRVGEAVGQAAEAAARGASELAKGFLSREATETFLSSIPEVRAGGQLEVASARMTETITRKDEVKILWDTVSLGVSVSEIKVPVTYRYHLRLEDPWRLELTEGTCIVYAPKIRPTQPPAIHTEGLEKRQEADWLRFDAADQLAALERSLTPTLRRYAADQRHLDLVRETARRTVAEFARTWLLERGQWGEEGIERVIVVFPGEVLAEGPELVLPRD